MGRKEIIHIIKDSLNYLNDKDKENIDKLYISIFIKIITNLRGEES